jgi:hypothetical protein
VRLARIVGLWECLLSVAALLAIGGCEDRMVYNVRLRHGVAVVEQRAENLWRDGIDCAGAESCADVLEQARVSNRATVTAAGGLLIADGYTIRGDEFDFVVRFSIPVNKLADGGPLSSPLYSVTLQRPSDVRAGRPGVPSIAVIRDARSDISVDVRGPSLRMSGGSSLFAVGAATDSSLALTPERVVDVLTRGRGRVHVIVPAVDEHGSRVRGDPWIQTEPGLAALLKAKGMLVE